MVHADDDVGEGQEQLLERHLAHRSDLRVCVSGLESGHSKDVHGEVCGRGGREGVWWWGGRGGVWWGREGREVCGGEEGRCVGGEEGRKGSCVAGEGGEVCGRGGRGGVL